MSMLELIEQYVIEAESAATSATPLNLQGYRGRDIRRVQSGDVLWYREERYWVSRALVHRRLGLQQSGPADPIVVWLGPHRLGELDRVSRKLVRRPSASDGSATG